VQKTHTKNVVTMDIGAFKAKETILYCPKDGLVFYSEELRSMVPESCTFGYDVMVHVGKSLFVRCRNNQEIMAELAEKNISISEREISYLGRKFIAYLALAHSQAGDRIWADMSARGGYILHLDGTCEGGSPHLFVGLDGISELVLDCIKLPSENKEQIIDFLEGIKKQFGMPLSVVHDLSAAIIGAVEEVFPGVLDLVCHFHFLRDIGKDLLGDDYNKLRSLLKKHKVRSSLRHKAGYLKKKICEDSQVIGELCSSVEKNELNCESIEELSKVAAYALLQWVLAKPQKSGGYGFPFDRPHLEFYGRLTDLHRMLCDLSTCPKPFRQVRKFLDKMIGDEELAGVVSNIEKKAYVFDKLRDALRIALPEGKMGLNDDGDDEDMGTIKTRVEEFRRWLTSDEEAGKEYAKLLEQLDEYWDKLFADPIVVQTAEGEKEIQPQRTDNVLERFFRAEKRGARRKSGNISLSRHLKSIPAETPLVRNLENEEYLDAVLDGFETLEERFAGIDAELARRQLKESMVCQDKLSPEVKKLISKPDLPKKIAMLFGELAR